VKIWPPDQVIDGCSWRLKLRFKASIDKPPDMPFQIVPDTTSVSKDLPFLADLPQANILEALGKKSSAKILH